MKNKNKLKKNDRHQRYPVEKFFSIRTVSGFTVSPDDKTIFFITNTTGSPQIWRVPIDGGWLPCTTRGRPGHGWHARQDPCCC